MVTNVSQNEATTATVAVQRASAEPARQLFAVEVDGTVPATIPSLMVGDAKLGSTCPAGATASPCRVTATVQCARGLRHVREVRSHGVTVMAPPFAAGATQLTVAPVTPELADGVAGAAGGDV